jgi:septal ring factor EnvC (AmiA/AmiB activator)
MAEVTNELMFEVLKAVQARLEQVDGKVDEGKQDSQALRSQMLAVRQELIGIHQELAGIHSTLIRHEHRLDRIDRRLEITDSPASAQ